MVNPLATLHESIYPRFIERFNARSSVAFMEDDQSPRAKEASPPVSAQLSNKSMKSLTLDDGATSGSKVHYVGSPGWL